MILDGKHAHQHRLDQGRLADRRPHEDLDRHALNTGAYVGAMALIAATGKPLPKFIPSFAWYLEGAVTKGFGKKKLYETAKMAMSRRKCTWTPADEALWDAVFEMTAPARDEAIRKGRKTLAGG